MAELDRLFTPAPTGIRGVWDTFLARLLAAAGQDQPMASLSFRRATPDLLMERLRFEVEKQKNKNLLEQFRTGGLIEHGDVEAALMKDI